MRKLLSILLIGLNSLIILAATPPPTPIPRSVLEQSPSQNYGIVTGAVIIVLIVIFAWVYVRKIVEKREL